MTSITANDGLTRYERLRRDVQEISENVEASDWQHLQRFGLLGLLLPVEKAPYILEVHQADAPRWCGRVDPQEKRLVDVYRRLVGHSTNTNFLTA